MIGIQLVNILVQQSLDVCCADTAFKLECYSETWKSAKSNRVEQKRDV